MVPPRAPSPILPPNLAPHLRCSVCIENYDAAVHIPLLLDCLHSVCKQCYTQLVGTQYANLNVDEDPWSILCPQCGQFHFLDNEAPVNRDVVAFAEIFHRPPPAMGEGGQCFYCNRVPDRQFTCINGDCDGKDKPICMDCLLLDHNVHGFKAYTDVVIARARLNFDWEEAVDKFNGISVEAINVRYDVINLMQSMKEKIQRCELVDPAMEAKKRAAGEFINASIDESERALGEFQKGIERTEASIDWFEGIYGRLMDMEMELGQMFPAKDVPLGEVEEAMENDVNDDIVVVGGLPVVPFLRLPLPLPPQPVVHPEQQALMNLIGLYPFGL